MSSGLVRFREHVGTPTSSRNRTAPNLFALLCAGLLCACGVEELDYAVGTLEQERIQLAADSSEPLSTIDVREGDRVIAGTVLLRQETEKIDAALTRARAEFAAVQARLQEAQAGPRVQQIEQARAQLSATESSLKVAELELQRQQSLVAKNYTSVSNVDILQSRVEEARAQRRAAAAEVDLLEEGTRSETLAQIQAQVAAAAAVVVELELTRSRATITAPVAGVVDSLPFELGERPLPGQTLVVLLASARTFARVHVPEPLRAQLHSGAPALVRIDGYPEDFAAELRWISADAAFSPYYALTQRDRSRLAYLAEVDLLNPVELPIGIPVEVRFPELARGSPRGSQ